MNKTRNIFFMLSALISYGCSHTGSGYYSEPNETYTRNRSTVINEETIARENYAYIRENRIKQTEIEPVSTFSIDVDTGSYTNTRRMLNNGQLPPPDAVRAEEFINYFSYDYQPPKNANDAFSITKEIAPSPWNRNSYLFHIGIKAFEKQYPERPASNLVFLIDVSGSMQAKNKLELLKTSLKLLTKELNSNDYVSIVTYSDTSNLLLKPTAGHNKSKIIHAIEHLNAAGGTNGAAGLNLAYSIAKEHFIDNGINRVILASDGDFNMGIADTRELKTLIEEKRKNHISLSTLGFGIGNYNDHLMEQLADVGNGNHAYIDTLSEAQKVLVNEMNSTLFTVAKDVKIHIEFNPNLVYEYRLIGYENRSLRREQFNNDKTDAGEIGSGHSVTAIYEITLTKEEHPGLDPLRYQDKKAEWQEQTNNEDKEIAFLKLRYKKPESDKSILKKYAIYKNEIIYDSQYTSDNFRFSSAVAAFAQKLRESRYIENYNFDDIKTLARTALNKDSYGHRGEFMSLISLAKSLNY